MLRSRQHTVLGLAVALTLSATGIARAATETGGAPGDWLARYTGARSVGLGSAYVASADASIGAVWNPAALGLLDRDEVLFESARLFEDTAVYGVSLAVPGRWLPSLGFSMVALRSGEFERTSELNESLGSFENGETAFLFTTAKHFGTRFALGANLKVVRQNIEDWSGGGFGADLGALINVTPQLRLGMSLLNVGGPAVTLRESEEKYPLETRGGATLQLLGGRAMLAAEIDHRAEAPVRLHAGAEYWIQRSLALRVGYDDHDAAGGFSCKVTPQVQIDYGVSAHELGLTHRAGVAYRFGGFFARATALPAVFSPTGDQPVTRISMQSHTKADADRWALQFVDKSQQVVRRFGGQGLPPAHVQWDGKDENGLPLADGVYRYQLVVYDSEGRTLSDTTRTIQISTDGPQGTVPIEVQ